MNYFLIDYENISERALLDVDLLTKTDTLILFYSEAAPKMRQDIWDKLINSGCKLKFYKLNPEHKHKNALDFYIASEASILFAKGARHIIIVSKDGGYQGVSDHLTELNQGHSPVRQVSTLTEGLMLWNGDRKAKLSMKVTLEEVIADYKKESQKASDIQQIRNKLSSALSNLKFKKDVDIIINLASTSKTKMSLYNAYRHEYGHENGTKVYNVVVKGLDVIDKLS